MPDDYSNSVFDSFSFPGALYANSYNSGNIEYSGDRDLFRIFLNAGQTYNFDLTAWDSYDGTLDDPYLRLLSGSGFELAWDDDSGVGLESFIVYTPSASGYYYLEASDSSLTYTGTYTISSMADDYRDSIFNPYEALGTVNVGGSSTGWMENGGDVDVFAVYLEAGKNYTASVRGWDSSGGTLYDPYMRILDGAGNQLLWDDDSGFGLDAQVTATAPATGIYYVEVSSFDLEDWGTYSVSVVNNPGDIFRVSGLKSKMQINDFDPSLDQIFLEDAKFEGLGAGSLDGTPLTNPKSFVANTSGLATNKKAAQIIYETDTGKLWYDSDGKKGDADAMHFATITNKAALSISDFELF
jgi:hypothetical protein